MRTGRNSRRQVHTKWREVYQEISSFEDCLQDLREKVRTGADPLSAGRSVAFVYIDLIDRALWLLNYVGAIAFDVFEEEYPLEEKMRRITWVVQIHRTLTDLAHKAVDGFCACFGGEQAIAVQAIVEWIGRQRAETSTDAAQRGIDLLAKIITETSKKKK